jgi:hypothetical protein
VPFGGRDITGLPHNGVDWITAAGTPIKSVAAGTVVVAQGDQVGIQSAAGVIESYLHIIPGLTVGQSVQAGQVIGTVDSRTGSPYTVGGDRYWSTAPHVHFALVSTIQQALSDTGGVNPMTFLLQAATGATPSPNAAPTPTATGTPAPTSGSSSGPDLNPFDWIKAGAQAAAGAGESVAGNMQQFAADAGGMFTKATGLPGWIAVIPGFNGILGVFGAGLQAGKSVESAAQDAIKAALSFAGRWVIIIGLAIAGLFLVLELFKPGVTVDVAKAATS